MGVAYIVQGANFAPANLGRVTQIGDVPVEAIAIIGPSIVSGEADAATFVAGFVPVNTTYRGVSWSIVDGGSYASIDSATGVISVLSGASADSVTIRATSTADASIYADKTITVTYTGGGGGGGTPIKDLTACINFLSTGAYCDTDIVLEPTDTIRCKFAAGNNGTIFGSRKAANTDDNGTNLSVDSYGLGYKGLKAKFWGTLRVPANPVTYSIVYYVEISASSYAVDPSLGAIASSTLNYAESLPIAIGALKFENATFGQYFVGDVYGIEIEDQYGVVKHRLIPQPDTTFLDEITQQTYTCSGSVVYRDNS